MLPLLSQYIAPIAWNLLTDRDALDALVGQLTPALSTVPSDVVAAATALAKVMLGPGFGCPLHSLRWVFALLQQIPVTPADSEFVPRPQPNGTGCTQVLRRLPSDECSQPHQRAVLCEVSGDAEASFEFRLSGCMLGQRLVGVCEVRIGGSDGVLHAGPAPAPDTAQGCLAQVHAVGPAGIIAVLCTRCFCTQPRRSRGRGRAHQRDHGTITGARLLIACGHALTPSA